MLRPISTRGDLQKCRRGKIATFSSEPSPWGLSSGHDPQLRVVTSSRRRARAPEGFAHALSSIEAALVGPKLADPIELTAS